MVSSPSGRGGANGSRATRSFAPNDRTSDVRNAPGDPGSSRSRPSRKTKRRRAVSWLGTISGRRPSASTSARVSGALSRNPFGPHSQRNSSIRSVRRWPPGRSEASRTTTSALPGAAARRCAQARPATPAPTIAMRGTARLSQGSHGPREDRPGGVRLLAQMTVEHHRDVSHEHPADGRDLDGRVAEANEAVAGGTVGQLR